MEHPQTNVNKQLTATPKSVWIRTIFRRSGREISDNQIQLLEKYVLLLLKWNTKLNLISRKDVENVWEGHILHSLSPLLTIDLPDGACVLDLGTGGGLPGIPWKILIPSISVTLIDATKKKVVAVESILHELQLSRIDVIWGRAESLCGSAQLRSKFDYVVARGVGPLDELAMLAQPFLRHDQTQTSPTQKGKVLGKPALLAFKGGNIESEASRTKLAKGVASIEVVPLNVETSGETELVEKKLVIVRFDNPRGSP